MYYRVEYRTTGGSRHAWEGEAEDQDAAILQAHEDSYEGMDWDNFWHSLIGVDELPNGRSFA
jgi:hypothetical protein